MKKRHPRDTFYQLTLALDAERSRNMTKDGDGRTVTREWIAVDGNEE